MQKREPIKFQVEKITQDPLPRPLSLKGEGRLTVRLGTWGELGEHARRIRLEVFVSEQGVPLELEFDSIDPLCVHALASQSGGFFVGTARLLPDGHIGRVAVARQARGQGVGGELLLHLMAAARERGHREVELFAQVNAQRFYERFGFIVVGPQFDDAGIPHVPMRAAL
jgi:predicted GNAT family N-acyltransferase